jgi:hypothetical protein
MITPEEIREKAGKVYPRAVSAWLAGDAAFFPYRMPTDLKLPDTQSELIDAVDRLRKASKEVRGYGYTILWEEKAKRLYGKNYYPVGIVVESIDDLNRLCQTTSEFANLIAARQLICDRYPVLSGWISKKWKDILEVRSTLPQLLEIVDYMLNHPRPNCFLRELPLAISTKVIERHKRLLREWFDILLPASAIDHGCDTKNFEQRYGFRYARQHLLMRLLDIELSSGLGCPWHEISLPAQTISLLPVQDARVFIVENKVNLLTLPTVHRGIGFGGLGRNVNQLTDIVWLSKQEIFYWGDIDVDGFEILSQIRRHFPNTVSMLMDVGTLGHFREIATQGNGKKVKLPGYLTDLEEAAFTICNQQNLRLEQEHIPQSHVESTIGRWLNS